MLCLRVRQHLVSVQHSEIVGSKDTSWHATPRIKEVGQEECFSTDASYTLESAASHRCGVQDLQ